MSADLIDRIRRLVTDGGMSRAGLARAAGLLRLWVEEGMIASFAH